MSSIRKKYVELFPATNWSDEEIIAHMYDGLENNVSELPDMTFDTDEELYDYLLQIGAIPLDDIIPKYQQLLQ